MGRGDRLPRAHSGYSAYASGFYRFGHSCCAGVGFDWGRYSYDSNNAGDPEGAEPRYRDQE